MSLKYAMYYNPKSTCKDDVQPMHPRVVVQRTVYTPELARVVGDATSISSADMKGTLEALAYWITFYLEEGCNVHLDGLGTFSLSLQSRPVMNKKEINSASIRLKNINFQCSPDLKERFRHLEIEREPDAGSKEQPVASEVRKQRIVDYLNTYQSLTRTQCMELNACSKVIAVSDLNELIAEEKILRLGSGRTILYVGR